MSPDFVVADADSWQLDPAVKIKVTSDRALLIESGPTIHRIANQAAVDVAETIFTASSSRVTVPPTLSAPDQNIARELMSVLTTTGHAVQWTAEMEDTESLDLFFETRRRASRPLTFAEYRDRLDRASSSVIGSGVLAEAIGTELTRIGISTQGGDAEQLQPPSALIIYVADGEEAQMVYDFNRERLDAETKTPWLLVQPFDGYRSYVGPLIVPETSACAECFRLRKVSNFPDDDISLELEEATILTTSQVGQVTSLSHSYIVGMVAQVVLDFVISGFDGPTSTPGFVHVLKNAATELSLTSHRVLRVPRCPECSPARGAGSPQIWFPVLAEAEASPHA